MGLVLAVGSVAGDRSRFAGNGVPTGGILPDLTARTLEGEKVSLSSIWKDGPVVFVTASLSCPVSRRAVPLLKYLEQDFPGRLKLVVIYTIEAHPTGDPSPYSGKEWVTLKNREENILVAQPKTDEERRLLAERFVKLVNPPVPLLIDSMKNEIWAALGAGPNMAVLADNTGRVRAKQDWFRYTKLKDAIEKVFKEQKRTRLGQQGSAVKPKG